MVNSRMKDFADILILQRNFSFNFSLLQTAIQRTYKRYDIPIPTSLPICFSEDFAHSPTKQVQWTAFRKKPRFPNSLFTLNKSYLNARSSCSPCYFLPPPFLQNGNPILDGFSPKEHPIDNYSFRKHFYTPKGTGSPPVPFTFSIAGEHKRPPAGLLSCPSNTIRRTRP